MVDKYQNKIQKKFSTSQSERPLVTIDAVVFLIDQKRLKILLIQRAEKPYQKLWALPGGFVWINETLEEALGRELAEETGLHLEDSYYEQLYTFSIIKRDPRARVITTAYLALLDNSRLPIQATGDAKEVKWFDIKDLPKKLAFDHQDIINYALERLRNKINYSTLISGLLPKVFTLTELQETYEVVLDKKLDKRNFRRKILSLNLLKQLSKEKKTLHRPAVLYQFRRDNIIFFD